MVLFSLHGGSTQENDVSILCSSVNMKMEDYEIFCKKHLSRLQEEAIKEAPFTVQHKNMSLIQFHGIPVLSPLVRLFYPTHIPFFSFSAVLSVLLAWVLTCNGSAEGAAPCEV